MNTIKRFLTLDLPKNQSCFLWGARKTGKSTFLKQQFRESPYIDFLASDIYQAYLREPHRLREELRAAPPRYPIIIDEVQKVPAVLDEIHALIESQKGIQFILCGSSARRLRSTGANLLGGRAWRYMFLPFCYAELRTLNWRRIFNNGLLPSHYLEENAKRSIEAYLYDYVLTEVQLEANLRKREPFARFLDTLGFCQGEMLNFSSIARDCGVSKQTIQTYFEILEDMYLGYLIYPYRKRISRQIVQETPKFYLFDTGIANYLKRYTWTDMRGESAGKAFEHYLFLELMAYKSLNGMRDPINYWRTKEGYEVDFVVQDQAIEVKLSTPIEKKHLKGLRIFQEAYGAQCHVISLEPRKRVVRLDEKDITIWPIQEFLDTLWAGEFWKP
jgi:predicted AAA+ superfamily ATPase